MKIAFDAPLIQLSLGRCNTFNGDSHSSRASQFSRYLLEGTGIPHRDKMRGQVSLNSKKNNTFRAFLALFKRRESRCPATAAQLSRYFSERAGVPERDKNARPGIVKLI
jgi:hypothetical protein